MGVFDDYVNGLEGKENLDPLEVVKELHNLHNQEIGTWEASVKTRNETIAERDSQLEAANNEVTKFKAMNLDLTLQLPGSTKGQEEPKNQEIDGLTITPDDLFANKE